MSSLISAIMKEKATLAILFCATLACSTFAQGDGFALWGDWSEPSDCSRTCGGGVMHRTRKCHHGIPGVSRGCQGEDIKYESCNAQVCPHGLESFKAVQCARFNTGQSVWIPYQDYSQQCALVCQASNTGRIQVLQDRVVDGTECDLPESLGICLGGVCKEVGCDRRISSQVTEDRCLVCGGRGETCHTTTGSITSDLLHVGEDDLLTIPQESTSISVRHVNSSSAFIVLTGQDGTVYLNTSRPPPPDSVLTAAGAQFRFVIDGGSSILLRGRGPTNQTLLVKLFHLNDLEASRLEFEYSVPKDRVLESNPNEPYGWIYGAWTSCSKECGDGYQLRAVSCIDRRSGGSVDDKNCDLEVKPDTRQACNVKPCGTANNWYRWVPGHWGQCSVQCGVGEQTQEMYCVETGPSGDTVYVKEELCERYSDKHPVYKRACEGDGEECPYWATTDWGQCSVTCGYGTETRQVMCQQDPTDPTRDPVTVDDSLCIQEQPAARNVCRLDPCPDGSNAHGMVEVEDSKDCEDSEHGCCPDGITAASGPSASGCSTSSPLTDVCLLEPERGPCSDYSIKWHYDPQEQKCRRFWYGGCQGNDNRFLTEEACEGKCLQKDSAAESRVTGDCTSRAYGCCPDGVTPARGPDQQGCPDAVDSSSSPCRRSRFGCCPDGVTAASGPNQQGCSNGDNGRIVGVGSRTDASGCRNSHYGCCADGVTAARGENQEGCSANVRQQRRCEQSYYGCCPGSDVSASGPNQEGCATAVNANFDPAVCSLGKATGNCTDYSIKWYYDTLKAQCERFWFGGCGGNGNSFETEEQCRISCIDVTGPASCRLAPVQGPCRASQQRYFYNHTVGQCQNFIYGGCRGNTNRFLSEAECREKCGNSVRSSDNSFSNRGNEVLPSNQVGLCSVSIFGCCRDGITPATGPDFQGCEEPCESSPHGCCEDGITPAQGPKQEGCPEVGSGADGDCEDTRYRCCPDGITAASGPNHRGCSTTTTTTISTTTSSAIGMDRCSSPSERGPCTDYVVRWYHDKERQECTQFWYGGCQGNNNRFETKDECEVECTASEAAVTEDPDFVSICDMAREEGSCRSRLLRWYHDPLDRQCRTFYYSGCQGNENNFQSLQECQQTCMGIIPTAAPTTSTTTTTLAPSIFIPPPVSSSLVMTGSNEVQEGTELRLMCRAEGPETPSSIEWFINGKRIEFTHDNLVISRFATPGKHTLTSELIIYKSSKNNTATYYCRSIPYNDVQRQAVVVSKMAEVKTTTAAPMVTTADVSLRESSDPAVVCRMPQKTGPCRAYFRRWYYDAGTQQCLQFVYGGCNGNSNNFESQQDCENYCRRDEPRTNTSRSAEPRTNTSRSAEPTDPDEVCSLPAVTGNCRASIQRWYYDGSSRQCRQFVYGGCHGNSNNFGSEQDCLKYCRKDDIIVQPETAKPENASTDATDPNVVCQLPVRVGRCRASIPRYYYSPEAGQCLRFDYGGCDGNSNNFESEQACNNYCRAEDICQQPELVGPCRARLVRYFYDTTTSTCRQFTYGGCQGNLNNFGSLEACQRKCASHGSSNRELPSVGKEVCDLDPDAGTCRGYIISWYYDSAIHSCQKFVYTGCQGNGNRFSSQEDCLKVCDPDIRLGRLKPATDAELCSLPPERGACRNFEIFWYYDADKSYCTRFYYGGCGGNDNRFNTQKECEQRCDQSQPAPVTTTSTTTTSASRRQACSYSRYGCCPNGVIAAIDASGSNCRDNSVVVRPSVNGDVVLVSKGDRAILDCYAPGSAVTWYHDGYYVTSDSRFQIYNNGTLVIRGISDDVIGSYACRINDGNNIPRIQRYELQIKVPLSILQAPATIRVGPGENAYLHCQILGTPTPRVTWSYQGSPIYSGGRNVVFNNGTLLVSAVTTQDTGTYKCTAQNGVDSPVSRDTQLVIAENLIAKIQPHSGVMMEGETAQFRCDARGYPSPSVTWEKDGVEVTSDSGKMYIQGDSLIVPRLAIEDAGLYFCVATNSMGTARDRTYLQVKLQSHRDTCRDTMPKMKCHLIVLARLCGHRMFSRRCCMSCRQAGLLHK